MLRTMAILIGLLNITLAAATAVLVLLAKERLHVGSVGYGALFTCMAVGSLLGSAVGDRVIRRVTATWTIRIGLLVEALTHLTLALATSVYVVGAVMAVFGIHAALWTIVGTSLRQRLTPAHMLGRVSSANLFISAGGNSQGRCSAVRSPAPSASPRRTGPASSWRSSWRRRPGACSTGPRSRRHTRSPPSLRPSR